MQSLKNVCVRVCVRVCVQPLKQLLTTLGIGATTALIGLNTVMVSTMLCIGGKNHTLILYEPSTTLLASELLLLGGLLTFNISMLYNAFKKTMESI